MTRLELKVDVPANVDEYTLSALLTVVNQHGGLTLTSHVGGRQVHMDVSLVDVERVVEFIDDVDEERER